MQGAQKCTTSIPGITAEDGVLFLLQMMDMTIRSGQVRSAKFFTMDVMDKQRDGTHGWLGMTMNKLKFMVYVQDHVLSGIKTNESLWKLLAEDVLPTLAGPEKHLQNHVQTDGMDASAGVTAASISHGLFCR